MTIKERLAERLRVLRDYGTAEEIEKVIGEITSENEQEEKEAARKTVGLIPSLERLGQRIGKNVTEKNITTPPTIPPATIKKRGL